MTTSCLICSVFGSTDGAIWTVSGYTSPSCASCLSCGSTGEQTRGQLSRGGHTLSVVNDTQAFLKVFKYLLLLKETKKKKNRRKVA